MPEFGIQASVKDGDDMVNVRGADGEEFGANADYVIANADKIRELTAAIKGGKPLTGQQLIERDLGGVVVGEIVESWPPPGQWAPQGSYQAGPPAIQQGYQTNLCMRCGKAPTCETCGAPLSPTAKSVKGGQYHVHEGNCPRDHKTYWCNVPK